MLLHPNIPLPRLRRHRRGMPEISRFLGIVVGMFYHEHAPPHFHAVSGEWRVTVEMESGVVHGDFPPRARRPILEWLAIHNAELMENWERARNGLPLRRIPPLE